MASDSPVLTEASVETLLAMQVEHGKIKNAPSSVQAFDYAIGSWIMETDDKGKPAWMAAPSFTGTMPVLNLCKKYGYVLLTKEMSLPPDNTYYMGLKDAIDAAVKGGCN